MAFFAPREFANGLTGLIAGNPDYSLYRVLCHPELGAAVKNEAQGLTTYLVSQRTTGPAAGKANIELLIEYALSPSWQNCVDPPTELDRWRLHQPSRNASTILSAPNRRLWTGLTKKGNEGISKRVFPHLIDFITCP
jgi:hypothetical protein